jgi:hypothetical protein
LFGGEYPKCISKAYDVIKADNLLIVGSLQIGYT